MGEETQSAGQQTKKCPKCGEEIQASAKRCKHCQADLRNWFARHKVITGIMILVVLIIIMINIGSKSEKANNNVPVASNSDSNQTDSKPNADSTKKSIPLNNNDPTIKQLGTLTSDYVGKTFVIKVNAETSDYYNYGFRDATKYYSLKIWDDSVDGDWDSIYAYVTKNDTNKQLVNALLDSSVQLEINASIPTAKWESGSNAFIQIDSWKLLQ
ncbi:zinc ribbon domain-containing protein [Patescibacteria group bacterium]|nr:zinc ribbon domain-containing protein [Patescibacteria group bacterium]